MAEAISAGTAMKCSEKRAACKIVVLPMKTNYFLDVISAVAAVPAKSS